MEYDYVPPVKEFQNDQGFWEAVAPALLFRPIDEVINVAASVGAWDIQRQALKDKGYLTGTLQTPETYV